MSTRRHRRALAAIALSAASVASVTAVAAPAGANGHGRNNGPTIVDLAVGNPELSSLVAAVQKAGLVETLSNRSARLTVFAPTNQAFADLLASLGISSLDAVDAETVKAILLDHVVGLPLDARSVARADTFDWRIPTLGGLQLDVARSDARTPARINNADIVAGNVFASNGVVHVIDAVLTDPDPRPSIVELAAGDPNFSILVEAVTKAGLVETLANAPKATVLAPTNDAFVALLGQLGLSSLDEVPVDTLRAILLDHVLANDLGSQDVLARISNGWRAPRTLGGLRWQFTNNGALQVNGVNITAVDIEGRNGVIHVIDQVLIQQGNGH
jgi:transforming growth factor-beta-induced protein